MGYPRISYNSKTLDFPRPPESLLILPFRDRTRAQSASGKPQTLNIASGFTVRAFFNALRSGDATEGDLKTALYELMEWAEEGQVWYLAKDSAVTVNTTLDGAAAAGATSIPVTSATGIVSGSRYAIESAEHVASVEASNTATDPVTITAALNYGFASGARLRAFDYLPMLGSIVITEDTHGMFYNVEITGTVDRRDL